MAKARYFVETWNYPPRGELGQWTPQKGVGRGPYTLFGLRKALRKLQAMGYDTSRRGGFDVHVWREEPKGASLPLFS